MRHSLYITLFLLSICIAVGLLYGQEPIDSTATDSLRVDTVAVYINSDSILAIDYERLAYEYRVEEEDSSLFYLNKAAELWKQNQEWEKHVALQEELQAFYHQKGMFEEALTYLQAAHDTAIYHLPDSNLIRARISYDLGSYHHFMGNYERALTLIPEAIEIAERVARPDKEAIAAYHQALGEVYEEMRDYEGALSYYNNMFVALLDTLPIQHPRVGEAYYLLGRTYEQKQLPDTAVTLYNQALAILKNQPKDTVLIDCYHSLAKFYYQNNELDKSLFNIQEALHLQEVDLLLVMEAAKDTIVEQDTVPLAEKNAEDAAEEKADQSPEEQTSSEEEESERANIDRTAGIPYNLEGSYQILSQIYTRQKNYKEATAAAYKTLELAQDRYQGQERHPSIAMAHSTIAECLRNERDFTKAKTSYQESLRLLSNGFNTTDLYRNPPIQIIDFKAEALDVLSEKAYTLYQLYQLESHETPDLKAAFDTYKLAASLLDSLQISADVQTHINLIEAHGRELYENAIEVAVKLYEITHSENYLYEAFQFTEKSKALLLRVPLIKSSPRHFIGLADSTLEREKRLRSRITFYDSQIRQEQQKGDLSSEPKLALWNEQANQIKEGYNKLLTYLQVYHEAYYNLRYNLQVAKPNDLVQYLNKEESHVVEYFIGKNQIYAFVIDKEGLDIQWMPKDFQIEEWVHGMREGIYGYFLSPEDQNDSLYQASVEQYSIYAYGLYQKLFAPLLSSGRELSSKMIVIPDAILCYLPFEALIRQKPQTRGEFERYAYLVKDYKISYGYSATTLANMYHTRTDPPENLSLIAFAPKFDIIRQPIEDVKAYRRTFGPLYYSRPEVRAIKRSLDIDKDIYLKKNATEANFKSYAPQYPMIHIASHAKVDDSRPLYSPIGFQRVEAGNDKEDGFLRVSELFNMQLNAEMVVLSACETGLSDQYNGAGLSSLAKGFRYAGARSLILTFWNVNEASSSEIIQKFYTHITKGMERDQALQRAKVAYLESANSKDAHPFYWSNIFAVGDTQPLIKGTNFRRYIWMAVLIGLALVIFGGTRKF